MGFVNSAKKKAFKIGVTTSLIGSLQISNVAKASEIVVRGSQAQTLFQTLLDLGVRVTADDHGGSTIMTRQIDCYKPVVPNPTAHCYVQEYSQFTEFYDETILSAKIYDVLDSIGAAYTDGSVGANKVGLKMLSCYQGIRSDVTECQGQAWD
jgi:hypothetical protein